MDCRIHLQFEEGRDQTVEKKWTNERIEILTNMWDSHSVEEIAAKLEISKNSVTGKATRVGLQKRNKIHATRTAMKSTQKGKENGVTFMSLKNHHCRYILTNGKYCGDRKKKGSAYCPHHDRICHLH